MNRKQRRKLLSQGITPKEGKPITIARPTQPAHVGGIVLPILSLHDIRNAPEGTVSGDPNRTNMPLSLCAMLHKEPPSRVLPSVKYTGCEMIGREPTTIWECEPYYGTLRRYADGFPLNNGPWAIIGISSIDETARHDWRDFQALKNQIVGEDWEGVELYPAERRHVDPSNRFYLWCAPAGVFNFGFVGRRIFQQSIGAPQRPYPKPETKLATEPTAETKGNDAEPIRESLVGGEGNQREGEDGTHSSV